MRYDLLLVLRVINSTDHTNSTILPQHPSEVLVYAARHNYPRPLREAAVLLLNKPWAEVIVDLPDNLVIPWVHIQYLVFSLHSPDLYLPQVRYHENWRETLASSLSQFKWRCQDTTSKLSRLATTAGAILMLSFLSMLAK
jgi:hypothetical protein